MIEAYKLDKHFRKLSSEKYSSCDHKLKLINKIINYLTVAVIILLPIYFIVLLKYYEAVPTYGIAASAIAIYTLAITYYTYSSTIVNPLNSKTTLILIHEHGTSLIVWKLYRFLKVVISSIGISLLLYLLDYFGIVNVYVQYFESDGYSILAIPLIVIVVLLLINLFMTIPMIFESYTKTSRTSYAYIFAFTPFLIIPFIPTIVYFLYTSMSGSFRTLVSYTIDGGCIGLCSNESVEVLPLYTNISNFNFIDSSLLVTITVILVLLVLNYIILKIGKKAIWRYVYE